MPSKTTRGARLAFGMFPLQLQVRALWRVPSLLGGPHAALLRRHHACVLAFMHLGVRAHAATRRAQRLDRDGQGLHLPKQ
jgi:hypothetical protein